MKEHQGDYVSSSSTRDAGGTSIRAEHCDYVDEYGACGPDCPHYYKTPSPLENVPADARADHAEDRIATLEAELARIRPVYEAACAWRSEKYGPAQVEFDGINRRLVDAVDAARSKP